MTLSDELLRHVRERLNLEAPGTVLAPAGADTIAESERLLGWPLHPDVRQYFAEVANGAAGFPGLLGGGTDDLGANAVESALQARHPDPDEHESGSGYVPRDDVLPVAYWGCAVVGEQRRHDGRVGRMGLDNRRPDLQAMAYGPR